MRGEVTSGLKPLTSDPPDWGVDPLADGRRLRVKDKDARRFVELRISWEELDNAPEEVGLTGRLAGYQPPYREISYRRI